NHVQVEQQLGYERRLVKHSERRPTLLDDLAAVLLERALEAADDLPAERVVGRDNRDLPIAECLRRVLAEGMRGLARCPARADDPAVLEALREVVGRGDGEERRDLVLLDLGRHRVAEMSEE